MWKFFYNYFTLPLLWFALHLLVPFNHKVRRGLRGKRRACSGIEEALQNKKSKKRLWIHASSMGEFEQAKPIIEEIKKQSPDTIIVASFFSPSGYENNIRYPYTDHITYLPFDSQKSVKKFLDTVQPNLAAFIRYDIWPNCVWECERRNIPIMIVNATLSKKSLRRLLIVRSFHHQMYKPFNAILTVSEADAKNFRVFHLAKPEIIAIGDTRYDRVYQKAESVKSKKLIPESITRQRKILVVGSCWSDDEDVVLPAVFKLLQNDPNVLVILVPHEPTIEHLEQLEFKLRGNASSIRFSYLSDYKNEDIIIIDSIGILLALYASAHVAFVGGGFKSNVHNVLEPAVYGIPVIYGPKFENSQEAELLQEVGCGFVVRNKMELYRNLRFLFSNEEERIATGKIASEFVIQRTGATKKILEHILPYLS